MRLWLTFFFLILSQLHASEWNLIQGVQFHESCLVDRENYPTIFFTGMNKGLACLKGLNTKMALSHFDRLSRMIDGKNLKITCNEKDYRWNGVAAHGSPNSSWDRPALGLRHPYISFKPASPATEKFLSVISFHESFHNLGYTHGRSIEYPFACEDCCFSKNDDLKRSACKICSTTYSDITSPQYLSDLRTYQKLTSYSSSLLVPLLLRRALLKNDTVSTRELLLDSDSPGQPLSILLAKRWSRFNSKEINLIANEELPLELAPFKKTFFKVIEGRGLMYDANDFAAAAELFLAINQDDLVAYAKMDKLRGTQAINSLFHDLDALWEKLGEIQSPLQEPINNLFLKIRDLKSQFPK